MAWIDTKDYDNFKKMVFAGVGAYAIPDIYPCELAELDASTKWIGFNEVLSEKNPSGKGCHFFLDDYQFERVWTNINRYLPLLKKYRYCMSPDFSLYADFPVAQQIWNHYRKHWVGAYLQKQGITVIPTIAWSDERSFDWCFDGEPVGGVVAVSSVGTQKNERAKTLFMVGYKEMLRRLNPAAVILYGAVPDGCDGNIIKLKPFYDTIREKGEK